MLDDEKPNQHEMVEINGITGLKRGHMVSAMIPIDRLKPVEWNANEMKAPGMELLKQTITANGFLDPLSVIPRDDGDFDINGGEHRWMAASELGLKEVPCDILWDDKWKDEEEAQFQSVRFNVIRGEMNPEKFLKLYNKMVHKHGTQKVAGMMGYTSQNGVDKIVKSVAKSMKDNLPPDMAKRFEEQAATAKTTGDLNKIVKNIFEEHGDSLQTGFAVFSVSGKEHVYIAITRDTHDRLNKLLSTVKSSHADLNEIMAEAFQWATDNMRSDHEE